LTSAPTSKTGRRGQTARNGQDRSPPPGVEHLEIELKLAAPGDALAALWQSAIATGGRTTSRRLVSTYYDTSDLRLRRRGFTLRVRQDGDRFVQTVKSACAGPGSVMRRGEWSVPVEAAEPDLTRLNDPEVLERIGLVVAGELQPLFTTDVTRQARTYRVGRDKGAAARIEAAWDRGEVLCNGRREAICELELELLDGSTSALHKEAVRLLKATPLEYQPLSKSERGFALALGERPTFRKANPPTLAPETPVEEGLERILTNCMNHWLANHAAVLDGDDPEGVHQMRVALRRLRSALTIFKGILPADDRKWLQGEAEALIDGLGGARDWDVFVDELLGPVLAARADDSGLLILGDAVNEQRRLAYERAWATIRSSRYLQFVLELGAWLEDRGWRRTDQTQSLDRELIDLATKVLQKRHKKAIKLGRKFEQLSDEALHRLRISLKKLRYATEFFGALYGKGETKAYLNSLRQLQDDLGYLNDLAVAEARLTDLCGRAENDNSVALQMPCGTVIGWHSHALAQVRPRIAKDWHAFAHAAPFWQHRGAASKP
jgi:triphosphatase